jgi:hypothetical protein
VLAAIVALRKHSRELSASYPEVARDLSDIASDLQIDLDGQV